jgi:hypothetical protein
MCRAATVLEPLATPRPPRSKKRRSVQATTRAERLRSVRRIMPGVVSCCVRLTLIETFQELATKQDAADRQKDEEPMADYRSWDYD